MVTETANTPRSYIVTTADGEYGRNRRHLRLTHSEPEDNGCYSSEATTDGNPTTNGKPTTESQEDQNPVNGTQPQPETQERRSSNRIKKKPDRYVETHAWLNSPQASVRNCMLF